MPLYHRLRSLWRNLWHRDRVEGELREELEAHLEMLVAARIAEGTDPVEARRLARIELGGMEQVKEGVRGIRMGHLLATVFADLRYGARVLRRRPGFTVTVVLTLALGIGANVAIFGLVDALLLRPLPVREPESLVMLSPGGQGTYGGPLRPGRLQWFSYPLFQRLRAHSDSFADLAAQQSGDTPSVIEGRDQTAHLAFGRAVSANYFSVLGVAPHRGRFWGPDNEDAPGANPVVVLSHGHWRRRFAGDAAAIGASVIINGTRYTVAGVGPPGFTGTSAERVTDFWVPLSMQGQLWRGRSWLARPQGAWLLVMGRLKAGVPLAAAEANANLIFQQFLADNPNLARPSDRPDTRIVLDPGGTGVSEMRPALRNPLLVMAAGTGLLLLMVCLNLCHLLLARAIGRQHEMNIRAALGAGRGRLLRQLFTESLLLCSLGAIGALLLAPLMSAGLLAMVWTEGTSLGLDVSLDPRTLSFTALLALASALLLGLLPALSARRTDLQGGLRLASPSVSGGGRRHRLLSRLLLTSQVAFALVLVVGGGLLTESLRRLASVDKGFDDEQTLMVEINPRLAGFDQPQALAFQDQLLGRVAALAGVRSASLSRDKLLEGFSQTRISKPGTTSVLDSYEVLQNVVTPGYFATMGMTLARGRDFTTADRAGSPSVAVISEALARRQFGSTEAVGKRFLIPKTPPETFQVVGIVRDVRTSGLRKEAPPMVFTPVGQQPEFLTSLEVRAAGDPTRLAAEVRAAVHDTNARVPVLSVRTLHQQVQRSLTTERILAILARAFGLASLLLLCLGLYGVISQWAAQRTGEIGVRMALGATPGTVRWMVMRQALAPMAVGVVLGAAGALAASRALEGLLFGLQPADPAIFTLATATLLAVGALAAYLPARRASKVAPTVALRWE